MAMKAQMFVLTMIFLMGLIFAVQQLLFQYTALDLSAPFRQNPVYLLENTKNIINRTIRSTPECADFGAKMEEFNDFLNTRVPPGGYIISLSYRLNCTYWNNLPPNPTPLNVSIFIQGRGSEASSILYLYHR